MKDKTVIKVGKRGKRGKRGKEEKEWLQSASGHRAEQKIFDKLQEQFSDWPCLLVNGFKEDFMIKVAKEKIPKKKKGKLSDQVKISWKEKYLWAFKYNSDYFIIVGIKLLQSSKQTFWGDQKECGFVDGQCRRIRGKTHWSSPNR